MFDFSGSMFTISCALASPNGFMLEQDVFRFVCSQTFYNRFEVIGTKKTILTQNSSNATSASCLPHFLHM